MSFFLGMVSGAGRRITELSDQETQERVQQERLQQQQDFQREMQTARQDFQLGLREVDQAAARRKEEQKQQQELTDAYALLAATGGPPEKVQAFWDAIMREVQENRISQSAALRYISNLKITDWDNVIIPSDGGAPEIVADRDEATARTAGLSMGELTDVAGPRPTPTDRSMGTTVRTDVTSPEVTTSVPQTGLPRVLPSPAGLGTQERAALAGTIDGDAFNRLSQQYAEMTNLLRENRGQLTQEDNILLGQILSEMDTAQKNKTSYQGIINTAFAGPAIAETFELHSSLSEDDPFFKNVTYQRATIVHDKISSAEELMRQPAIRDTDGSVIKVDDSIKLKYIEDLLNDPQVPRMAIPTSLIAEYIRIKSESARGRVTGTNQPAQDMPIMP